jgi:hypothetical protein
MILTTMDLAEHQRSRRKRGAIVLVLAMFLLGSAIRVADAHNVSVPTFLSIYFGGVTLGAGIAIVVASYRVMREVGESQRR